MPPEFVGTVMQLVVDHRGCPEVLNLSIPSPSGDF